MRDAFERARHDRTPQLLTLVGVPGIGKSRLVYELFTQVIVPDPDLITWRQGRCLAYGDGITLWALGEIVKAQAGVLEQDSQAEIAEKLRQVVEDTLAGTGDEVRVETHLLALLGLSGEAQLGGDRRNESFAAWRRFLEGLAEQRPLVVVVEDIHWADESLLDFLDELVDWVTDVPLLVVATARPELLERRPGWGGGKLNATTLALSPLSDDQTALLLGQLLGKPLLEAESQRTLLERAGGNPLYAEQYAELFAEQGSTEELPLPETLQGIIAARLDGLPDSEKSLLQDAAVVGKVFWASSIGRSPEAATVSLHSLERKGFVRRQRRSSLEGESEFAFAHALVRDVAYGQIPRADRGAKHRRDRRVDRSPRSTRGSRGDARVPLAFGTRACRRVRRGHDGSRRADAPCPGRGRRPSVRAQRVRRGGSLLHRSARTLAGRRGGPRRAPLPQGPRAPRPGRRRTGGRARAGARCIARGRRRGDSRPGRGIPLAGGMVPRTRPAARAPHRAGTGARRQRWVDPGQGPSALPPRSTAHALERARRMRSRSGRRPSGWQRP